MVDVDVAHTCQLSRTTLERARQLLVEVFEDDLGEHDWEHALGGMHALAWEGDELVGHGSVVQRRLLHAGRAWRTGYVEGVGIRADRRGLGHGGAIMAALEAVVHGAYELGALGASDAGAAFYASRSWQLWQGPTSALTPSGIVRTPEEDDCTFVLPVTVALDLTGDITCDWRDGDLW
ncbi:GNAT family N-acetyltransferase [Allosaccharopolyspora coralli]|uniref:GNAT family N-acetyltransferase n=2 Tax=Allosaccharopolyspora coralli TaxID=2665642 RepID=A0A5Q3Q4L0_9PSEU|nr:GNAT family N-acetyltransferase [Allosaccharopolyspora coralli]QGK68770.1 GNAT family N-acetyltransferase [Allosaccharopolyspora coralli]